MSIISVFRKNVHLESLRWKSPQFRQSDSRVFRKDRNSFGGGVLIYVSNDINVSVKQRTALEFNEGELIWLEISLNNFKLLLCSAYRSPGGSNNFWDLFDYSIEQAFNGSQNIVIIGDLNIDLLRERNHRLNEIASFYELRNTIHEPTHMGSLLDPIFVSNCNF